MKLTITHPDKILFPKENITKKELAEYYEKVSRLMIPHLKNRPITMKSFPKGIKGAGFFQKNAPKGMPQWIKIVPVKRKGKQGIHMILCGNKKTLVWLVNQNCITPHIWLSKTDKPNYPDRMIFDLDPPKGKSFDAVIEGALSLKEKLEKQYKLKTFVMTTGSRGLHIVVPIKRTKTFDQVRAFAKNVASEIVKEHPKLYTLEIRKNKRRGRIFLDVLRNGLSQTVVAPYAVRSKDGAPIATPLNWNELKTKTLKPDQFTIRNISARLCKNPWRGIDQSAKSLII